jgi:hypothetical protein
MFLMLAPLSMTTFIQFIKISLSRPIRIYTCNESVSLMFLRQFVLSAGSAGSVGIQDTYAHTKRLQASACFELPIGSVHNLSISVTWPINPTFSLLTGTKAHRIIVFDALFSIEHLSSAFHDYVHT